MPTSLGIMQILVGPPPPPPPCDGCCPTRTRRPWRPAPRAGPLRVPSDSSSNRTRYSSFPKEFLPETVTCFTRTCSTPRLCGKLVQEHCHEEQDAEDKELPGTRNSGQEQAVAQYRDDDDAEYG